MDYPMLVEMDAEVVVNLVEFAKSRSDGHFLDQS